MPQWSAHAAPHFCDRLRRLYPPVPGSSGCPSGAARGGRQFLRMRSLFSRRLVPQQGVQATPSFGVELLCLTETTFKDNPCDLASLLDVLQIPSAHAIGSSAGGPISLTFAALYPHRVRSLTLAGTGIDFFPVDDPVSDLIRQLIAILEQEGAEAAFAQRPADVETSLEPLWVVDEMQARGRYAEFLEQEQRLARQVQTMSTTERARYFSVELRSMQAYMRDDVHTYARQVKCPTLVLHGSDDREVPLAWGEALAKMIPTARMHIIPGGGHSLVHHSVEGRRVVIDLIQGTKP